MTSSIKTKNSILLAGMLLVFSGSLLNAQSQEMEEFQEPQLLYLGWDISDRGDDSNARFWTPEGEALTTDAIAETLELLSDNRLGIERLHHGQGILLAVFDVDPRAVKFPIRTMLKMSDGTAASVSCCSVGSDNYLVVAIMCQKTAWEEVGNLQVTYPISEPELIWSIDKAVEGEEMDIAEGVSCAFRRNTAGGGKIETCFQPGVGDWAQQLYKVHAFLDEQDDPVPIQPIQLIATSSKFVYEVSDTFDLELLTKIRVEKQQCKTFEVGEIKIRNDLKPAR